jgi:hypothetical protein
MTRTQIENLLDMIEHVVKGEGDWRSKRKAILDVAEDDERTNLEEFATWFAEDAP